MAKDPANYWESVRKMLSPEGDLLVYRDVHGTVGVDFDLPTPGDPHPDSDEYPDHEFVWASPADENYNQRLYYAAARANQDDYNFTHSTATIGGLQFNSVVRTYLTKRADYSESTPAPGAAMPRDPDNKFPVGYILLGRKQVRLGEPLDGLYVAEEREYVERVNIVKLVSDDQFGGMLSETRKLYYTGEVVTGSSTINDLIADPTNAYWGVGSTGLRREGEQLSDNWYLVTETQVVPARTATTITGSTDTGIPLRSFDTEDAYLWPAILRADNVNTAFDADNDLVFVTVQAKGTTDGGRVMPRVYFSNPAYRGPTKMRVQEWWRSTALTKSDTPASSGGLPESAVMIPREIEHRGANYHLTIEPTLHGSGTLTDVIGTEDPNWESGDYSQAYPATTPYTTWPSSLIVSVEQAPFRGGYKISVVTAYRPDHYVPPTS